MTGLDTEQSLRSRLQSIAGILARHEITVCYGSAEQTWVVVGPNTRSKVKLYASAGRPDTDAAVSSMPRPARSPSAGKLTAGGSSTASAGAGRTRQKTRMLPFSSCHISRVRQIQAVSKKSGLTTVPVGDPAFHSCLSVLTHEHSPGCNFRT